MKDLLESIVRSLVNDPDAVSVERYDQGDLVVLELRVAPEDMGKVIGKQGRIAQAIRSIMKARAARDGRRVDVKII
jgi:predicted RNA-binding protein YlqC (UPF0109 family)